MKFLVDFPTVIDGKSTEYWAHAIQMMLQQNAPMRDQTFTVAPLTNGVNCDKVFGCTLLDKHRGVCVHKQL